VQLTVELVKCTLLLNRLLVLQIYCVLLVLIMWRLNRDCEFGTGYVLSTVKVQLTVELVKCTLLLNRLLVLQIYCVLLVLIMWRLNRDCEFGIGYVLSTVKCS